MKTPVITLVLCLLCGTALYGQPPRDQNNLSLQDQRWGTVADRMPSEWYASDEAKAVADQVLLYQREAGGWPKNIAMHHPLTPEQKEALKTTGPGLEPTLDNGATTTEMKFMARMYEATQDARYRQSFERGLDYLLEAQYDNGGWPQFYPLRTGYYTHITFNDDAIVNILRLLKEVFDENPLYGFVATPEVKAKASEAFDRGIDCILKTQIRVDDKLTVWCAQHDETTFEPAKARSYELPSFSGGESAGIVLLLMEIENPSPKIRASIEGAVEWMDEHKIEGIRLAYVLADGTRDRHVVEDASAPAIWARFYDLETGKPYFCGRDGIKKENLADIEYERRNGYSYYTNAPQRVLDAYPAWKARLVK